MEKWEKRDRVRGQLRTLKYFFKNLLGWEVSSVGARLGAGFFLTISVMLAWIPYQEYGGEELTLPLMIGWFFWFGLFFYLRPYLVVEGTDHKGGTVMEKLKYLPVDRGSILLFLFQKLFKLLLPLFLVQLAGQCVAAFLSYGALSPCNLLYPLIAGLLCPGGIMALVIVTNVFGAGK